MIKYFTIVCAFLLSGCFSKEVAVAKQGDVSLSLYDTPCQLHSKGQHAEFMRAKDKMTACWILENGIVWVLYEDGDKEQIPKNAFTWK
jgi:hypothetical protein